MRLFWAITLIGISLPINLFAQVITNPIDLIQRNKVKESFVYLTRLDTISKNAEELRLVFTYDSIGRRITTGDYHSNKLMGTYRYYYQDTTFNCWKSDYVLPGGSVNSENQIQKHEIFECQKEFYGSSSKFKFSTNSSGLFSVMIGYSKVVTTKNKEGKEIYSAIDLTEPQFVLRFDYIYY